MSDMTEQCYVNWTLLLEYVKVFLSWPPLVTMLVGGFLWYYRERIGRLVDRLKSFQLPGVSATLADVVQQDASKAAASIELPGAGEPQADDQVGVNMTYPEDLPARFGLEPDVVKTAVEWSAKNPGPAIAEHVEMAFQLRMERVFNVVFGTQVHLLIFLANSDHARPLTDLLQFYEKHKELIKQERSVDEYVGFLQKANLIEDKGVPGGPLYAITPLGIRFLGYIRQFYPFKWNSQPY